MVKKFKPTPAECAIIRDCAKRSSGHKAIKCEPGIRTNIEKDDIPRSINIAEVSDKLDWEDTDLWSTTGWDAFRKRATLTDDGRGIFDFYVYSLGYHGELETNVIAYYENGKLVRVTGTCDGVMWRQPVDCLAGYHDGQSAIERRSRWQSAIERRSRGN